MCSKGFPPFGFSNLIHIGIGICSKKNYIDQAVLCSTNIQITVVVVTLSIASVYVSQIVCLLRLDDKIRFHLVWTRLWVRCTVHTDLTGPWEGGWIRIKHALLKYLLCWKYKVLGSDQDTVIFSNSWVICCQLILDRVLKSELLWSWSTRCEPCCSSLLGTVCVSFCICAW